jgi:hypothetical protein
MLYDVNRPFAALLESAWTFLDLGVNGAIIVGGWLLLRRSRRATSLLLFAAIALVIEGLRILGQLMTYYAGGVHLAWNQPAEIASACQSLIVPAMLIAFLRRPVLRRSLFR